MKTKSHVPIVQALKATCPECLTGTVFAKNTPTSEVILFCNYCDYEEVIRV